MKKIKILVTGADGQLGNELRELSAYNNNEWVFTDVPQLDITDHKAVDEFFENNKLKYCVNCAAYTAVDKAETEQDKAFKINTIGLENIANACKNSNIILIHISTDYVFSGTSHIPYAEHDNIAPSGIYAKTKAEGEKKVIQSGANFYLIRTAWLYSTFGHNFVKTILRLTKEKKEIGVVYDQIGSPTYAKHFAQAIISIIDKNNKGDIKEIYHFANAGIASWYDVAQEIIDYTNSCCIVKPILTDEYPLPAPRPHYSVLNTAKIKRDFNINIPHWKHALHECLNSLKKVQKINVIL